LKNQLEAARRLNAEKRPIIKAIDKEEEEVVVLSRTDNRGVVRPVLDRKHPVEPERGRRKKQKVMYVYQSAQHGFYSLAYC